MKYARYRGIFSCPRCGHTTGAPKCPICDFSVEADFFQNNFGEVADCLKLSVDSFNRAIGMVEAMDKGNRTKYKAALVKLADTLKKNAEDIK